MATQTRKKTKNAAEARKRKWDDVPCGIECYMRSGKDALDETAQRILRNGIAKFSDEEQNFIRDLIHERRWLRDMAVKWYLHERKTLAEEKREHEKEKQEEKS